MDNVEVENPQMVACIADCWSRARYVMGWCRHIFGWKVVLHMSSKEAWEGILRTTFEWCAPGGYAIVLIAILVAYGPIGFVLGFFAPFIAAWYGIVRKREREATQRLEKPTRYLTDEERHEAIEYMAKAKEKRG